MPDIFDQRANKSTDIFEQRAKSPEKDIFDKRAKKVTTKRQPINPVLRAAPESGFVEGLKESSLGRLLGKPVTRPSLISPRSEKFRFKAGAFAGDIPAMAAGGALGLLAGGPVGGAAVGGAGAFMFPELIKQLRSYVDKAPKEGLLEKIGDIADIPLEVGKQGIVGALTGLAGRFAPLLKGSPVLAKLLKTKAGQEAVKGGAELATMTGAQAALSGEVPSAEDLIDNALLLGAYKAAGAGIGATRRLAGKKPIPRATPETAKAEIAKVKKTAKKLPFVEKFQKEQKHFDTLREVIGKKNERLVTTQEKWNKAFNKSDAKDKFTNKQYEDATYYAQKTPNPEVKGDNFKALRERVPESLRKVIDKDLNEHFKTTLKERNKNKYLKKVIPREAVVDRYLPGLYENPEKFNTVSAKVKTKDPFTSQKQFLNYHDALVEGGLKPRFKNIRKIINAYDQIVAKEFAAADMLEEIQKIEKDQGKNLVVAKNEGNGKEYAQAQKDGWVPFDDVMLRRLTKTGVVEKPSSSPALVSPELSNAIRGIFNKNAYKPGNPISKNFWKGYDALADTIRTGRVKLSFFHFVPLTESLAGAVGAKKTFGMRNIMKQGDALLNNIEFKKDAARSGLVTHKPLERWETSNRVANKMVDTAVKLLPEKVTTKAQNSVFNKGLNKYIDSQKFLFEKFHPRIKMVSWKNYVDTAIDQAVSEGKPPSEAQVKQIKNKMADLVNNQFGGQNWEIQRMFNNPEYKNWLRRVIAYPDWTTSAIRQAAGAFSGGLKGQTARRYWLRFGINTLMVHGALKFLNGGFRTAKDGKGFAGVTWDKKKAERELVSPDPLEWYKFPLPDADFNVAGIKFNPGRTASKEWKEVGERTYTHFGKQALEIKDWFKNPLRTFFTKSNPIISMAWKQGAGSTPSADDRGGFPVRGKFKKGKFRPWDASEKGTGARLVSRAASLAAEPIPFSVRALKQFGPAAFLTTGLGSVPISKGTTKFKSIPALEKAFKKNDIKMVNRIRAALKDNGWTDKQIKLVVNKARRDAK